MAEVESQSGIVVSPPIKANFQQMAKSVNADKKAFVSTLQDLFGYMGDLMASQPNVEIDLGELGKFQSIEGQVMYAPVNRSKPAGREGKQTVRTLMDQGGKN